MNINYRSLLRLLSIITITMGCVMIPCTIASYTIDKSTLFNTFIYLNVVLLLIGILGYKFITPSRKPLKTKDGYIGVTLSLIFMSIIGSLPFILSGQAGVIDSFFEAVAGFTTTSATTVGMYNVDISLAFWKASMHWMGGIFILIYSISYLPMIEIGGQQIATAESLSLNLNKIAPKRKYIIKSLSIIYFLLTGISFIFISLSKIPIIEALIYAFGTVSTSAVKLFPEGLSHYNNIYLEVIISIFSILAATSFVMYFYLSRKYIQEIKRNIEKKVYFALITIITLVVFALFLIDGTFDSNAIALKDAFVQVSSFITTSGYATSNYLAWPIEVQFILLSLMFVGGCGASTAGSMKVIRIIIVQKLISRGFVKRLHPRAIKPIKIGDSIISAQMASNVTTYVLLFFFTLLGSTLVLSLQNLSIETSFSAAIGALSNTGISFGSVGPSGLYNMFNPVLKLFLCFVMITGRLSIYTIFILFMPSFWKKKKRIKVK